MATSNPSQILEAKETFICEIDGERFVVHAGTTRIAASHRLAKIHPTRFSPIEDGLSFPEAEEATNDPGVRRARPNRQDRSAIKFQEQTSSPEEPKKVETPQVPPVATETKEA